MLSEGLSEEDDLEYEEENSYNGPVKNKYETEEVKFIQGEIQLVTRKIEREKIKLRIADERLEVKKKNILNFKVSLFKKLMKRRSVSIKDV